LSEDASAIGTSCVAQDGATNQGHIPERRQELYEKIVELLLSEWEQGKFTAPEETTTSGATGVPSLAQVLKVSLTDLREALEKLAFDAHQTQPAEAAHRTADLTDDQLVAALYKIKGPAGEHGDPDTLKAHLKERLGLADYRLQSFGAIAHWHALVFTAYAFIQHQRVKPLLDNLKAARPPLGDVLADHQRWHGCQMILYIAWLVRQGKATPNSCPS
jgi:hypothetical protein